MQTIFKHKGIIIGIVVIVIILVGYFSMRGSGSQSSTNGGVTKQAVSETGGGTQATATGPGQEFVSQLLAIQNINLNLNIFTDVVFMGLQDFSHEIPLQPVSRPNPFAPVNLNEVSVSSANEVDTTAGATDKPAASGPAKSSVVAPTGSGTANSPSSILKKSSSAKNPTPGASTGSLPKSSGGAPAGDIFQALPTN